MTNGGTHAYAFDAENRIVSVDGGSTASYVYNAGGDRVRKTTSSGSVDYLYDLSGHTITELSSSGAWNRGEVFAGAKHLATYTGGTGGNTNFNHADWLGTERARSTSAGAGCETSVSLPFGDGLPTHAAGGEKTAQKENQAAARTRTPKPQVGINDDDCSSESSP